MLLLLMLLLLMLCTQLDKLFLLLFPLLLPLFNILDQLFDVPLLFQQRVVELALSLQKRNYKTFSLSI